MAEDNGKTLVGSLASSVASGVYEGVKGAAVGGLVGAATLGVLSGADNLGDGVKAVADYIAKDNGDATKTFIENAGDFARNAAGGLQDVGNATDGLIAGKVTLDGAAVPASSAIGIVAGIGAAIGAAAGAINGLIGNTSAADRANARGDEVQTAQINQLAAATQMLGGAVIQQQQQLAATNHAVEVIGKHTKHVIEARGHGPQHAPIAQSGHFTAKENARREVQGSKELGA